MADQGAEWRRPHCARFAAPLGATLVPALSWIEPTRFNFDDCEVGVRAA